MGSSLLSCCPSPPGGRLDSSSFYFSDHLHLLSTNEITVRVHVCMYVHTHAWTYLYMNKGREGLGRLGL